MRFARRRLRRAVCALVAASVVASSRPAGAVDKAACVDAAETGQTLRNEGRLISARDRLLICASPECPEVVSQDCTGWLGEVQRRLASVVVRARDSRGDPLSDVAVSLDGAMLTERAPTAAIELDPGDHVFRCERAGFEAAQQRVRLAEGERGREIVCELTSLTLPASTPVEAPPPAERPSPSTTASVRLPWTVWALGGLGVAGLGSFAVFGLWGRNDEDKASHTCKPNCTPDVADAIRTKYVVADVSLAVGLVALGAAAIIGVLHATAPTPQVSGRASVDAYPDRHAPLLQLPVQHWVSWAHVTPTARHWTQALSAPQ
jgi:hypothetical protein